MRDKRTFYSIESHHDQQILKYKLLLSVFVAQLAKPLPLSEASLLTQHLQLGHSHLEIIEHLLQAVIEAKIKVVTLCTKVECEICRVSKAILIVLWCLGVQPTRLYEWVAFNLVHIMKGYNDEQIFLHLPCLYSYINYIYTLSNKKENILLKALKEFIAFTKMRYNCTI